MVKEMFNNLKTMKSIRLLNSNRGLSLIAVLWMVTILTVLASEFMYSLQLEVKTSRNWNDSVNAYYSAKGGFETAIANLNVDETSYDSLDEDWAQGFIGELNNSSFEAKLIDESTRINVNTADEATLTKVIEYCLSSQDTGNDKVESEITAEAQQLASAVVAKRPYRTIAEVAKAEGMTPELLYGYTDESSNEETNTSSTNADEAQNAIPLIDVTTVFSLDKNVSSDGSKRININSADASQIQQGVNPQAQGQGQQQQVITQQEAQAIVDYRSQSNNNQGGVGQTAQNAQGGQNAQSGQTATSGQTQTANQTYKIITDLLNVPAISQQTLDAIRDRIDIQDSQQDGQQGGQNQQQKININSASATELQSLGNQIDDGISNSIINYRQNNQFSNVDGLLQVKAISIQDLKTIADKVTTTDDATLAGKININTAPLEILKMLPGMDEEKANAIIAYRQTGTTLASGKTSTQTSNQQTGQQGGPLDNAGKLLDVQGIDENTFRQLVDMITYRTYTFRIESTGKSQDEKIVSGFTAIIDRSGDSVKIKYWKQY